MNKEHHVGEMLSGYLDGELTQQDSQRVEVHVSQCTDCASMLDDLKTLQKRMGDSAIGDSAPDWHEHTNDSIIETAKLAGFSLLGLAGIVLVILGVFKLATDSDPGWAEKVVTAGFYVGLGLLLISVVRQRLLERKNDKYNKVEI